MFHRPVGNDALAVGRHIVLIALPDVPEPVFDALVLTAHRILELAGV